MAELVDATDSKSVARKGVWVQVPPRPQTCDLVKYKSTLGGTNQSAIEMTERPSTVNSEKSFLVKLSILSSNSSAGRTRGLGP